MLKGIVFDFDGVILESVDIKTQAFIELFQDYPAHLDRIVKLHLDNGGMSRFEKFEIIYRDYLRMPVDEALLKQLGKSFSELVYDKMLNCPFVPGAEKFLNARAREFPLFVVSGAPEDELRAIVERRNLARLFQRIYGSPRKKSETLAEIMAMNNWRSGEIVFIGDALGDYASAHQLEVPFIGRVLRGVANLSPRDGVLAVVGDLRELDAHWNSLIEHWAMA